MFAHRIGCNKTVQKKLTMPLGTGKTSQESRRLASVTLNSWVTMIVMNSGSQLSEMTTIPHFKFICICSCVPWVSLSLLVMSCLPITLIKCLKGHKVSRSGLWRCSQNVVVFVIVFVFVILLVKSCLLITLIKCRKGHKSLGLLLGGILKMSLSLSILWSCHVFSSLWTNVSKVTSL